MLVKDRCGCEGRRVAEKWGRVARECGCGRPGRGVGVAGVRSGPRGVSGATPVLSVIEPLMNMQIM